MDITNNNKKIFSNKFINTETVSYSTVFIFNILFFFALKTIFINFIGIGATYGTLVSFIIASVSLWICEGKFVFYRGVSSKWRQIIMLVFRSIVDIGFYKLNEFIFGNLLDRQIQFVFGVSITMIFFFNYFFDGLVLFECVEKAEKKHSGRLYRIFFDNRFVVLSVIMATICILFIYATFSVFPFGDTTVMRMDLYHQYGPLFAELYDRVIEHKSFFYSWESGGGSSFLGNYFNYLSSPLTTIIFFFSKKNISFAITTLVTVKCVLSAGTFSYYLKRSLSAHSLISSSFGVFYAFSGYYLAYYWNVMWLDGMILLPLIALGIEKIVNDRNGKLYVISLSLLLYSSYYMGYMCCIFSVLYFFAYFALKSGKIDPVVLKKEKEKKSIIDNLYSNIFINRALKFACSSLLVGAICAFVLIPVYMILNSSSATSDTFPDTFTSYFKLFDFITSHLAGLETTIRSSGDDVLPNVYCSILTIVLAPLFIINKDIRIREKAVYVILLLFFLFSFDNNIMNFLWHAFHFPNDLPYRFSYMYSFVLMIVAFKAFKNIKAISIRDIGFCGMAWIFFILLAQKLTNTKMSEYTIYVSIALIIIWTGILMIVRNGKTKTVVISTTIFALTFCEIAVADIQSQIFSQDNTSYVVNYDNYTQAISKIEESDDSFYRTELCYLNTRMDPCYYGYNGMSTFSSMAYEDYSGLQYSLGMFGNRINSYTYNTQTPVYDMMFNIKYLIHSQSMGVSTPSTEFYTMKYDTKPDDEGKTSSIFSNDYYLPIAYCISEKVDNWVTDEGNPFELQGDFFSLASGYKNVFVPCTYNSCEYDSLTGDEITENGTLYFSKPADSQYGFININVTPQKEGEVYAYITSPDAKSVSYTKADGNTLSQSIEEPYIIDLGYAKMGESISASIDGGNMDATDSNATVYFYTVDKSVLDNGYKRLKDTSLNVTKHSETLISGTINANEKSYLYTSIPYDEGWSVYVDGKKAETFSIGDCMLCAEINPGKHDVKLKYTPKGIKYGLAISGATMLGFAGYCIIKRANKRKNCNK